MENLTTIKTENTESLYEIEFDPEELKSLIKEIYEKCSIRCEARTEFDTNDPALSISLFSNMMDIYGNKLHENIRNVKSLPVDDPEDYWRNGDEVPYEITSDKLFTPLLAYFLTGILHGKYSDDNRVDYAQEWSIWTPESTHLHHFVNMNYDWFKNREELKERDKVQGKIFQLNNEINSMSNFDIDKKIAKLEELRSLIAEAELIPEFDPNLLSEYYDRAEKCLHLNLIQETRFYGRKLTQKNNN